MLSVCLAVGWLREMADIAGTAEDLLSFFENSLDIKSADLPAGTYLLNLLSWHHPGVAAELKASSLNPDGQDSLSDAVKQFIREHW